MDPRSPRISQDLIRRRPETGSALLELLFVTLIVGLLAAALLTNLTEMKGLSGALSSSQESPPSSELSDLDRSLARWTRDPSQSNQELELSQGEHALDSDDDRKEYEAMVGEFESAGLLDEWESLLKSKLPAQHPLLTALDPEAESSSSESSPSSPLASGWQKLSPDSAKESVEISLSPSGNSTQRGAADPEIVWADGQPVVMGSSEPPAQTP